MRKIFFLITLCLLVLSANAQKGENRLLVAANIGLPTGQFGDYFNPGPGGLLKILFGVAEQGQITGTVGITIHSAKGSLLAPGQSLTFRVIPILAGIGYSKNNLDLGFRYQSGQKNGESLPLFGIHLGYMFTLKSKR